MLIILLFLFILVDSAHHPLFKVHGTLSCYGMPYEGRITVLNYENLHVYSAVDVDSNGYFRLAGEIVDELEDVRLFIEHNCVDWKNGRFGSGPDMFSEYPLDRVELILNRVKLNIELSELYVKKSVPKLYLIKVLSFGRRMLTDNRDRLENSDGWKIIREALLNFRKAQLR